MAANLRRAAFLPVVLAPLLACAAGGDRGRLTAADTTAIDAVRSAYVRAWLDDDTAGVLATLDSGAVLLPPGQLPVEGHAAIRAFWWPNDGSRTDITAFDWTVDEVGGAPGFAFTRGTSTVGWRYEKDTVRTEQTSRNVTLTLLQRGADGRWRIARQMWGPSLPDR